MITLEPDRFNRAFWVIHRDGLTIRAGKNWRLARLLLAWERWRAR